MKSFHNILLFSDVDGTIAWSSEYINPKMELENEEQ